jgi:hypothetical protein
MSKVCRFWKVCIWKVHVCISKHNNVFLMINRCILKDTKVFESFSMHLGVFIVYFIVLIVYSNVIQCTCSTFQSI